MSLNWLSFVIVLFSLLSLRIKGSRILSQSPSMTCGSGVSLCGVLVLESGYGSGDYEHTLPSVHGLWPEVSPYGDSNCVAPSVSSSDPSNVYYCYAPMDDNPEDDGLWFEDHEWTSHGICAGVKDADDFFQQVCDLSVAPLALITPLKEGGQSLTTMATNLTANGYQVWDIDTSESQLYLSVCAKDGIWVFASQDKFVQVCGE